MDFIGRNKLICQLFNPKILNSFFLKNLTIVIQSLESKMQT
jgi:hypothetical protein